MSGPTDAAALTGGTALGTALGTLAVLERLAWVPERAIAWAGAPVSDIQFDLNPFVAPPVVLDGVPVRFGPIHTVFATARLSTVPTRSDQLALDDALATIEQTYPWRPDGVFTHIAYGLPYFAKLPRGLLALHVPRLLGDTARFALEEAVPAPTDVHPDNPAIRKRRFHLPVRIEHNDLLFTLRGDDPARLADVLAWLGGRDTLAGRRVPSPRFAAGLRFTTSRAMFVQMGLPRKVAAVHQLPFAEQLHPRAEAWLGDLSATDLPAVEPDAGTVTFAGSVGLTGGRLTTAEAGDYFDNGAIQHLSHDIVDLQHFFAADDSAFVERVRCAYRSPLDAGVREAHPAGPDGGPPHPVPYQAQQSYQSQQSYQAHQAHQRLQGPGFDPMDVPGGDWQPKLQFSIFVPMSQMCAAGRAREAELDQRFVTATRRQNFLVPPRRHRAFPLAELI